MYIAVEPSARVPATALVLILQTYSEGIGFPWADEGGDVEGKGIVAIGPVADLLTVDIDTGVAHRPIEAEEYSAVA